MAIINYPKFQTFDANGDPLSGGKLYTYEQGTSTLKTTYSDPGMTTAHANPIVLDSLGENAIYGSGYYKFVLKDSTDTEIWTVDEYLAGDEVNWVSISDYDDSLNTAVSEISTTPTTLLIDKAVTISQNVTVPATLHLLVLAINGGALQPATGITVTFNCPITAGSYQIFGGTGTNTISGIVGPIDKKWISGGEQVQLHPGLLLEELASAPTTAANEMGIYSKVIDGQSELFVNEESAGDEIQVTDQGKLLLPRGWLAGLQLSTDTDTDHDILIAVGECKDAGNTRNLILGTAMTKQIDATWAAGDDAGGMFTGAVANTTWYHVFLIRKDSDGSIDAGFDTSVTAANIPTGYTEYRRLGSVLTDGSANILGFSQVGDEFLWDDPPLDVNITNLGTTAQSLTLSVPPDIQVRAIISAAANGAETEDIYISSLDQNDEAAQAALGTAPGSNIRGDKAKNAWLMVRTNTSKQVRAVSTSGAAAADLDISTLGWIDRRGKDD
jgi:hypothetical protein